jgi:hypothetical protein
VRNKRQCTSPQDWSRLKHSTIGSACDLRANPA